MDEFSKEFANQYAASNSGQSFVMAHPITGEIMEGVGEAPLKWGEYPEGVEPGTNESYQYDVNRRLFRPFPHEILEANSIAQTVEMPEGSQITDPNWQIASRIMYEYTQPKRRRAGPMRFKTAGQQNVSDLSGEEMAHWGVKFMSSFENNIPAMVLNVAKLQDAPPEVTRAMYYMLETSDREGVLMSNVWRGLGNIAVDPSTWVGLATLGIGLAGRETGKQVSKMAFKELLRDAVTKQSVKSSTLAVAGESAFYGAVDNLARQEVAIEAGQQDGINVGELSTTAGISGALGETLGTIAGPQGAELLKRGAGAVVDRLNQPGQMPTTSSFGAGEIDNVISKPQQKLNRQEKTFITNSATKNGTVDAALADEVSAVATEIKNNYQPSDGWVPISVASDEKSPSFTKDRDGKITIKWVQPAYEFDKPKDKRVAPETHKKNMVSTMVSDIGELVERAKAGDQKAIDIIEQANWYRSMRSRLRKEFGGLGDVFADILGATSAQTGVQQNYKNALEVLRRFTRGEFDAEIKAYEEHLARGGKRGGALFARDKDASDEFSLIRSAAGKMFGANSPAATEALLDMFRQVKLGSSPKTINFTGNLIGYGNDATIDVWAARYLRKITGRDRIPPPAEPGVSGKHLTRSTLDNPRIGQEFGFGQTVFSEAAKEINKAGTIKNFKPELGDMGPDDLQAVIWFLEKENWTNNGWTSKIGEGGSFDYESKFGGSPDRARVEELRSIIGRKGSTAEEIAEAKTELKTLEGELQRYVAGVSRERPDQIPTNIEQAELAAELTAPLMDDPKVTAFQANNTVGEFVGDTERALNYEIVTQTDFDPTNATRALVEAGRKYDQDAVFLSKVVDGRVDNARPGVEVYFKERQGIDYAQQVSAILREKGLDGFTFITDSRQADRVSVQANTDEAVAGLTGIRFQYIPEFDDAFDPSNAAQIFEEKAEAFKEIMRELGKIDGITYADVVHYETQVFKNTDRSGTEWINGGVGYGEYLGGTARERAGEGGDG